MYNEQIKNLSIRLKKSKKAIVAIGCSFVQGQGAVNDELYLKYKWDYNGNGEPLVINTTKEDRREIINTYRNVKLGPNNALDFTAMEYNNSFVEVLCNKYFRAAYTPINFGLRGCGNRASIKELYFHPEFEWDTLEEIIVIYSPSGLERFDFINDTYIDHFRWKSMWPSTNNFPKTSPRQMLWEGYARHVYSEKFAIVEQISHVQELVMWCKLHNAKLIITPGFDRRYDKDYFKKFLASTISREMDSGDFKSEDCPIFNGKDQQRMVDRHLPLFPWDNIFKPLGHDTFADLSMSMEQIKDKTDHFFQFLGKGSPNMWITPCAHPSAKAHDLFAKVLFNFIKNGMQDEK